jgi:hypothetical protein
MKPNGYANCTGAARDGSPPPARSLPFSDDRHVHGNARQPDRRDRSADNRRRVRSSRALQLDRFGLSSRRERCHATLWQARGPLRPQVCDDGCDHDLHYRFGGVRSGGLDEYADCRPRAAGARWRWHHGVDLCCQCGPVRAARTRALPELFEPRADGFRRYRAGSRRYDERSFRLALDLPRQCADRLCRAGRPCLHATLPEAEPPPEDRLCGRSPACPDDDLCGACGRWQPALRLVGISAEPGNHSLRRGLRHRMGPRRAPRCRTCRCSATPPLACCSSCRS